MTRIPLARDVVKALRSAKAATQRSHVALNKAAGLRMAKGDYTTAEALALTGKELKQFQGEVEALIKRWRELSRSRTTKPRESTTPLWVFFQPILRALVEAGGDCPRSEIEKGVERLMGSSLLPADRAALGSGRERWRNLVSRARKSLVAEGWIEADSGARWRITEAGRQVAEGAPSKSFQRGVQA